MSNASLPPAYFDALYAADPDPWRFATSEYERAKYTDTLAALPAGRFASALEVGCSIGVLTAQLADRCDRLLSVDLADAALADARRRCADRTHVDFARMVVPQDWPDARFDLIVFSEVLYYLSADDIAATGQRTLDSLRENAAVLLVHWTGLTDYPQTADDAVALFMQSTAPSLRPHLSRREPKYRLDLLRPA